MATPSIAMIPSAYKAGKLYSVLPTNGDGDLDVARASSATRVNQDGLIELMANNVPRLDYSDGSCPSLLVEPQSTNLYLNSDTLVTQGVATSATTYTVSFYGTGTITFSGTYVGSLVGTGLNDRVTLTFTATAGTLTSTVSGSVLNAQVEALGYATSYIPTTGATVTRLQDEVSKTGISSLINSEEGVLYAEISALSNNLTDRKISLSDGTTSNTIRIEYLSVSNAIWCLLTNIGAGGNQAILKYTATDIRDNTKIAFKYGVNSFALWVNGVEVDADVSGTTFAASTLNSLRFDRGDGVANFEGEVKDLRVYDVVLSDEELATLTT